MDNFHIDNKNPNNFSRVDKTVVSEFDATKIVYSNFKEKMSKSDFSNSPMMAEKELELLNQLHSLAIKDSLDSEIEWIETRISELQSKQPDTRPYNVEYYTPVDINKSNLIVNIEGIDKADSAKFQSLFQNNFTNIIGLKNSISKMYKAGISAEYINEIIKSLAVFNEDGTLSLSETAVDDVVNMKKTLFLSRNNEHKENNSPLNLRGVDILNSEETLIVMRDNKVSMIIDSEGKNLSELRKDYNEHLSLIEDNLLQDFVSTYKTKDGNIDKNAQRVFASLRQNGITNAQVLPLTEFCLKDSGINVQNVNAVNKLKQAGALDREIVHILSNVDVDLDGNFVKEDLDNACELTSAVMFGDEVVSLLPKIRNNPTMKEFVFDLAPYFEDKSCLYDMVNLVLTETNQVDTNAQEIINNLVKNVLCSSNEKMKEDVFVNYASDVVSTAKNAYSQKVNDDSAGIVAIMCNNKESADNILTGLLLCKDNQGEYDNRLAQILWDLSLQNADINEITEFIQACKDDKGNINSNVVETVLSFLENGEDKENVKKLLFN